MSKRFVAHVYEDDYRQIQELVQQYPNIETGGDLFGLWKDKSTVVIQQFIGPGKNCKRTSTSFHQDIKYLEKVGSLITNEEGLCNVGEWHSHHQIGMPQPSAADRRTVFSNMPHLGLERFVLFIATIESKSGKKRSHGVKLKDIELRPFLFEKTKQEVVTGEIKIIRGENPHRLDSRAENEIENGKESPPPQWQDEKYPRKREEKKGDRGDGRNDENRPPNTISESPKSNTQAMTTQPTGSGYSSDQSLQRPGQYTQPTGQTSAQHIGPGKFTVDKMNGKGFF